MSGREAERETVRIRVTATWRGSYDIELSADQAEEVLANPGSFDAWTDEMFAEVSSDTAELVDWDIKAARP